MTFVKDNVIPDVEVFYSKITVLLRRLWNAMSLQEHALRNSTILLLWFGNMNAVIFKIEVYHASAEEATLQNKYHKQTHRILVTRYILINLISNAEKY